LTKPIQYISKKNVKKQLSDYQKEKVVIRQLGNTINAMYDENGLISTQSVYCIISKKISIKFLLGLLNSKLIDFIYQNYFKEKQEFPRILLGNLKELSIPSIPPAQQQPLISLVNEILTLKKSNQPTEALEKEIDRLVYELYGLSEEEIEIIEGKRV
jgi:hypothetical protein